MEFPAEALEAKTLKDIRFALTYVAAGNKNRRYWSNIQS
jgi:hypothetical protein